MSDEAVCIRCGQVIDLMEQDWYHVGSEGFSHAVCPAQIEEGAIGG